jgi:hypothetical protein
MWKETHRATTFAVNRHIGDGSLKRYVGGNMNMEYKLSLAYLEYKLPTLAHIYMEIRLGQFFGLRERSRVVMTKSFPSP